MSLADPWDAEVSTAKAERRLRESEIQEKCVAYARSRGWWARKFSSPANRSVPDYLFAKLFSRGAAQVKLAVEFKAPGKAPTEAQLEEQRLMRDAGWSVWPNCGTNGHADIKAFKARLDSYERMYG